MNLFVLAWNISTELIPLAINELRQMVDVYPQLDPDTIWHWKGSGGAFAASMHVSAQAAAPRIYVSRNSDGVTFYDGSVVVPQSNFNAHDAEALSSKWDLLPEITEGQFVLARVTNQPLSIEVMTDFLGMKQVYYFQQGNMWLISNSVRLIEKITQASSLDPLGVSLFLSMGWVGSDRTLKQDILTIPGGQCWKWELDKVEPTRKTYFTSSQLAQSKPRRLTRLDTEELAEQLIALCRNLAENLGRLRCPLTGGRDSRLLASFLIHAGIPAEYYTSGVPSSGDVQIATQIAKVFNLPHEVNTSFFGKDLLEKWKARLAKIGYSQATKSVPMPLAFDRAEWLEANKMQLLSELRELCLDQSDSLMWNFVNRSRFEHITSLDSKQAKLRQKHIAGIYNIATLFYYALST